jgi:hypothetical protein
MAHLALHFPVVKRNTDSSFLFELRELKELPVRFVFMARPFLVQVCTLNKFYPFVKGTAIRVLLINLGEPPAFPYPRRLFFSMNALSSGAGWGTKLFM